MGGVKMLNFRKFKLGKTKRKSLHLNDRDIALLKMLSIYDVLSKKELNYYSCNLYGDNEAALKKRLERWCAAKVIVSKVYGPRKQLSYQLGINGKEIVEEAVVKAKGTSIKNVAIPRNKDHFFGLRDLMVKIHVEVERLGLSVQSYSPYELTFKKDDQSSVLIRPDWIIKINKWHFNIEFDTGSESVAMILDKAARYAEWAKHKPNEYHHVLLTVIDNADTNFTYVHDDYGIERRQRVFNLKQAILDARAHIYPNLRFTVAQITRMPQIVRKLAMEAQTTEVSSSESEMSSCRLLLHHNQVFDYTLESEMNPHDFYLYDVEPGLYGDAHLLLKQDNGSQKKAMIITYLSEGDVKVLDRLSYLNLLKEQGRFKVSVDYIVGVYSTKSEWKSDSIGKQKNVLFTSMERLCQLEKWPFYE